eukprot:jgi/Botrbrau1/11103/Bobra.0219s0012.1
MAEIEAEALAYLQKLPTHHGDSVFEHLEKIVKKLLVDRPTDAVDLLDTSLLVKKTSRKAQIPVESYSRDVEHAKSSNSSAAMKLFSVLEVPLDPVTGEIMDASPPNEVCHTISPTSSTSGG